jgi:hypothetical protein
MVPASYSQTFENGILGSFRRYSNFVTWWTKCCPLIGFFLVLQFYTVGIIPCALYNFLYLMSLVPEKQTFKAWNKLKAVLFRKIIVLKNLNSLPTTCNQPQATVHVTHTKLC